MSQDRMPPLPAALRARAEAIAAAMGEDPELILRLALRVGLQALPERLGLDPEDMERAQHALGRRRRAPEPDPHEPTALGGLLGLSLSEPPRAPGSPDHDPWEARPPLWSLAEEPSVAALRKMIAGLDDQAGHHIVWVDPRGGVHATCLPPGEAPARWMRANSDRVLLMETYSMGSGYVGPEAAEDAQWMGQLYEGLLTRWEELQRALQDPARG